MSRILPAIARISTSDICEQLSSSLAANSTTMSRAIRLLTLFHGMESTRFDSMLGREIEELPTNLMLSYVPYKYEIGKLIALVCSTKEQLDPSAYCILTARSKIPGVSLTDFCAFTPKWITATNTIRPPVSITAIKISTCVVLTPSKYYHRTMATEMMGLISGTYGGSAKVLEAGGLTCDSSYVAHGGLHPISPAPQREGLVLTNVESYDAWKVMTTHEQEPVFAGEGTISFMFHMSSHLGVTKFAINQHPNPHRKPRVRPFQKIHN